MKIYVASSWRNQYQQDIVKFLRECGFEVYDFKNPKEGDNGFHWSEIDENWKEWTPEKYREAIDHPIAQNGFKSDFDAMKWADVCILLLPCGRSAHTEAGWMKGAGKKVFVYIPEQCEPELMYKIYDGIFVNTSEMLFYLSNVNINDPSPDATKVDILDDDSVYQLYVDSKLVSCVVVIIALLPPSEKLSAVNVGAELVVTSWSI